MTGGRTKSGYVITTVTRENLLEKPDIKEARHLVTKKSTQADCKQEYWRGELGELNGVVWWPDIFEQQHFNDDQGGG